MGDTIFINLKDKKIKYIVFDLDGTIVENGALVENVYKAFQKLKKIDIHIIIATGRGVNNIYKEPFIKLIKPYIFNMLLLNDGNVIYDIDKDKTLIRKTIPQIFFEESFLAINGNADFVIETDSQVVVQNRRAFIKYHMIYKSFGERYMLRDLKGNDKISRFYLFPHQKCNLKEIIDFRNNFSIKKLNYLDGYEISPPNFNKFTGLDFLMSKYTLDSPNNVLSFGDGKNDLFLLKNSAIGISVKNSHPQNVK